MTQKYRCTVSHRQPLGNGRFREYVRGKVYKFTTKPVAYFEEVKQPKKGGVKENGKTGA